IAFGILIAILEFLYRSIFKNNFFDAVGFQHIDRTIQVVEFLVFYFIATNFKDFGFNDLAVIPINLILGERKRRNKNNGGKGEKKLFHDYEVSVNSYFL